jgi:uncharacterized protein
MDDLQFTWDPAKGAANLSKHGVSFEDASTVFRNHLAKVLPDPPTASRSNAHSSSGIRQEGASFW